MRECTLTIPAASAKSRRHDLTCQRCLPRVARRGDGGSRCRLRLSLRSPLFKPRSLRKPQSSRHSEGGGRVERSSSKDGWCDLQVSIIRAMWKQRIAEWYRGRPVGNGQVVHLKSYRRHWSARWAHVVVGFGQRYWVGAVFIALVGLMHVLQQLF